MAFIIDFEQLQTGVASYPIGIIPWDSETFGFNVADLKLNGELNTPEEGRLLSAALNQWMRERIVPLVGAVVPAESALTIARLQQIGFIQIDTVLDVVHERAKIEKAPRMRCNLRRADPADMDEIMAISGSAFRHGRYHADPFFPKELADKRYRDWIRRAFEPINPQEVLVCGAAGEIRGFSVIESRADATAYFHLFAAAEEWQSSPLSVAMFSATLHAMLERGARVINSRISAANTRVMNVHAFFGARFTGCAVQLHLHRGQF